MTTLSPLSSPKASSDQPGVGDTQSMSPVAIVQKQLAVLAEMATEGQTEAAALQAEVADLTNRLSAATARITRLEATLSNQARMLKAVCGSLQEAERAATSMQLASAPHAPNSTSAANQSNGALDAFTAAAPDPSARPPALRAVPAPAHQAHQEIAAASAPPRPAVQPNPVAQATPTPLPTPARPEAAAAPAPRPAGAAIQSAPAPQASAPVRPTLPPSAPASQASAPVRSALPPSAPAPHTPVPAIPTAEQSVATPAPAAPQPVAARVVNDKRPRVQRGSTVEVSFDDGSAETYTIVRQDEANPTQNHIGENSPLGSALLGACVGEERAFRVRLNAPEQTVRVRAIA